ncbi:MAG: adenylyltransferase/cytidyltransferase family protein [Candidatus Doudnabacteria bacterium]|nr:adenylyltransferase/cytidyltransferase family protein [bacterium]MDZ4243734.1 adenylyltransferase/cytidyltransferase family protein [Candidatus Doudnabacteria bacterium]
MKKSQSKTRRPKVVAISGGFDPVHIGHIDLIRAARALGGRLVAILNNDNWLLQKKGYFFMAEQERKAVLESIRYVDRVIVTGHQSKPRDMSVCRELKTIKPDIFANGGDRKADNIPEYELCNRLGIKMVFNVGGGKKQSSSELVRRVKKGGHVA